ncbi:MAG TPA: ABC transporter permease [Anaerolineae bacterium]
MAETLPDRVALPARPQQRLPRPALPGLLSLWRRYLIRFTTILGLMLVVGIVLVALFAGVLSPFDPWKSVAAPFQPPGPVHWLGTDDLGRDLLSGVIYAIRTSLIVSLTAVAISTAVGTILGAFSGYLGGLFDDLLMRFTEFFQVIPRFFLALVAVALFRPGLLTITVVLGLTSWPMTTRLLRAQVLSIREREYVLAARALGAGSLFTLRRHILPNSLAPVVVHTSLMIGQMMLIEASLAFLGLGDPNHISLGYLLRNAQSFLRSAWWMFLFPGLAIALAVIGFNLIGDSINDIRMRRPRPI